jgi:hypothetical protein
MLYKIWGFQGGDYKDCRLLGYKTPVRTSQETHYVSATEPSRLMLCKIWGFHGGDYEDCCLLGHKTPVLNSQEIHYVSATEPSRLMLCKIWGFHGGDYEDCRLLGYKTRVRTSQETHYVSATEPSRLMLCKIWVFHFGNYRECHLLWCDVVWLLWDPMFRREVSPPSSGCKEPELGKTLAVTSNLLVAANIPSSQIFYTLMMEAIRSPETSWHPRRWHYS